MQFTPPVSGLVACANASNSETTIHNTSADTVWYVFMPSYSYWTFSSDEASGLSATTLLFRSAMRGVSAQGDAIPSGPTIEPDFTIRLDTPPNTVQLKQDPAENAAWQEVSLLVETAVDKGEDEAVTDMENASSPTNSAMIACAKAGYDIGSAAADQDYSAGHIALELHGINGSAGECGRQMDEADTKERQEAAHAATISASGIDDEIRRDPQFEKAGSTIEDIARDAERSLAELRK